MGRWLVVFLFLVMLGFPSRTPAETYVAAGVGMNAPTFDTTDAGKVSLQKDLFYGGKIGHYFNDRGYNWFGLEVTRTVPHQASNNRPYRPPATLDCRARSLVPT